MATDETTFVSSSLVQGSYDDEAKVMRIEFASGRVYVWERVDPIQWDRLKSAISPGRALREMFPDGIEE